jgi:hypothetical protein
MANGLVAWCSRRQPTQSQSSCEAEYKAAADAAKELLWVKRFINDLNIAEYHVDSIPLHVDNKSSIKLTKNIDLARQSKHIEGKHHLIRECIMDGDITVHFIPGAENPADMFTKALGRYKFEDAVRRIGMDG